MPSKVVLSLLCWVALGLLTGRVSRADDPLAKPANADARAHLQQGNKLYRLREFQKAIEEYKAGVLAEDAPVFAYNLGQCYRQLGEYQDAIWHYQRFLDRAHPSGDLATTVEGFIGDMRAELEKHAMSKPPTEPAQSTTTAAPSEAGKPRVAPSSQPASPSSQPAPPSVIEAEPWYADAAGWSLTGSGVAAGAVATYLLFRANDLDNQANAEPRQDLRAQLHDEASTRRWAGAITAIAAGGLLVSGVIKLAITPSARSSPIVVGVTGTGIEVFGRF